MTAAELHEVIAGLQHRHTELDDVEAKLARTGTPEEIWRTICAFANRRGGGIILFGVDPVSYAVVGIGDADQLQRDVVEAASNLEPPVRVALTAHFVDGRPVLVAEVPEVETTFQPCYYRSRGPYHGAFIRVGDSTRQMTEYEVYLALASRVQPTEDLRPVEGATQKDMDGPRLESFLTEVRLRRPALARLADNRESLLRALNIVSREDPRRPTLAGLLAFGRYPQEFFPSLVITVSAYADDRPDPANRLDADTRCEGPVLDLLEEAVRAIRQVVRTRVLVRGIRHEMVTEYPVAAIREALVNAVAHRDYSRYAAGTQIQVRFFPDRVEIQNPGGLCGVLSIESLGELGIQVTRNAALARLLEELGPMENRGTGLAAMAAAMRQTHLLPPEFHDGRTSFRVTLRNEAILTPGVLDWLGGLELAADQLSERQRLALAYAHRFGRITNGEYRVLAGVDSREATRDLQDLAAGALLVQQGLRGGTRYVVAPDANAARIVADVEGIDAAGRRLLATLAREGESGARELAERLKVSRSTVAGAIRRLVQRGLIEATTTSPRSRNRRYRLAQRAHRPD